jgi:hypothetical protein
MALAALRLFPSFRAYVKSFKICPPVPLAATMVMSVIVVTVNRTLWQRLYRLAATRFKLET